MKLERSDIEFPLWRKKVDASLFKNAATPIPKWLCKVWDIENLFAASFSKKNSESIVKVIFKGKEYSGNVVLLKNRGMFRLFFEKELCDCCCRLPIFSTVQK